MAHHLLDSEKQESGLAAKEFKRRGRQKGLERRHLATVRWTVATAVAFPQESESWPTTSRKSSSRRKGPRLLSSERLIAKMDSKGGIFTWGFSSAGRAPALQAGGQRFDPANLHQGKIDGKTFSKEGLRDRKAALGNMPGACCNRRGFSAEKRSR